MTRQCNGKKSKAPSVDSCARETQITYLQTFKALCAVANDYDDDSENDDDEADDDVLDENDDTDEQAIGCSCNTPSLNRIDLL